MEMPITSLGSMSLVNWMRWKEQSRPRASACASVVLPTPGTPSISRCPRANSATSARRTTSSVPRITRRSAPSSCIARCTGSEAVREAMLSRIVPSTEYRLLLQELRRTAGQALDALADGWMGREQAGEVYPQQRLHDEQVRARRRSDHGDPFRISIQLLQRPSQRVRIAGKVRSGGVGLILARARHSELD